MRRLKKVIWLLCALGILLAMVCIGHAEEIHPSLITISGGQSIGDGSYINHSDGSYPFIAEVELDEGTIPLQSCVLGVYSWDCDEDATEVPREYDMVFVNGTFVGVLTGQNQTWKTSYMDVPVELLHVGTNTITIYVGEFDTETGSVVQSCDRWRLTVDWLSLQCDGGVSADAPDRFELSLNYASRTESGISCEASVIIESSEQRSYVVEYSLVDYTSGSSPTYGQIIADDVDAVSGTSIGSTGYFFLPSDAPMGVYEIQATLRDPISNTVYAYTTKRFDLGVELNGSHEHVSDEPAKFVRTEYNRLKKDDPDYDHLHHCIDQYVNVCSECGAKFYTYRNSRSEAHSGEVCVCGWVSASYNAVISAQFSALKNGCAGEQFAVTVKTYDTVYSIGAENAIGYPIKNEWTKVDNGDGTITWTRVYVANLAQEDQFWTVSAFNRANVKIGSGETNHLDIREEGVVTPGQVFDNLFKKGQFVITVLDGDTGSFVQNATVTLQGKTLVTNASGQVTFERSELSGKGFEITAADYYPMSDSEFKLGTGDTARIVTIYKEGKNRVLPLTCNSEDIATGSSQLNTEAALVAEINVTGKCMDGTKIIDYSICQNGKELAKSTDGAFSIDNSQFVRGATLTAEMTTETNGKQEKTSAKLNIVVVSEGPDIWLGVKDIPILNDLGLSVTGLPDVLGEHLDLKTEHAKSSWKNGGLNSEIKFDDIVVDNYTMTAGVGVDVEQDFVKLNKALRERNRQRGWQSHKTLTFSPAFAVCIKFNEKGIFETTGTIGINLDAHYGKAHQFLFTILGFPVPIDVEWDIGAGVGVFGTGIDYDWAANKWVSPDLELEFTGEITGKAGVGCKFANAGLYGKLTLNADGTISFVAPIQVTAGGKLNGEVGLQATIDFVFYSWSGKLKIVDFDFFEFKLGNVSAFVPSSMPIMMADQSVNPDEAYEMMAAVKPLGRLRASTLSATDVGFISPLEEGAVPAYESLGKASDLSGVQLASVNDKLVMVYQEEESTTENLSYGHLVYRVMDQGVWSEPQRVSTGDEPEGDFVLASDGNAAYIVFVKANRPVDTEDLAIVNASSMEELVEVAIHTQNASEIVVARFDGTKFVDETRLTNDAAYDDTVAAVVLHGVPTVAWVKNSDDVLQGFSANNAVMLASLDGNGAWQQHAVAEGQNKVKSLAIGELNNEMCIAALVTTDNDYMTQSDDELKLIGMDGTIQTIGSGNLDSVRFVELDGVKQVLWYQDGQIMKTAGAAPETLISDEFMPSANYRIVTFQERTWALYPISTNEGSAGGSDIYALELGQSGTYPVRVTVSNGYVDAFDAIVSAEGFSFVFVRTELTFNEESFATESELCYVNQRYTRAVKLYALDWYEPDWEAGQAAQFEALLGNEGTEPVTNVTVQIAGAVTATQNIAVDLAPGAAGVVTFMVTMPETMTGTMQISVLTEDQDPSAVAAADVSLDYVELTVTGRQVSIAGKNLLSVTVVNNGSMDAQGSLYAYANDSEGPLLFSKYLEIGAQSVYDMLQEVDDYLNSIEESGSKVIYLELVTAYNDVEPLNNEVSVVFRNVE